MEIVNEGTRTGNVSFLPESRMDDRTDGGYVAAFGPAGARMNPGTRIEQSQAGTLPSSSRGTILLIDDEEMVRNVTKRMLERFGFRVLTAPDGLEGIALFRDHWRDIECVLLDCTMPRMSGQATLLELRRIREDARIILVSGYCEQAFLDRSNGRPNAFMQKPYSASDLEMMVLSVLDEPPLRT